MKHLIDQLRNEHRLSGDQYLALLRGHDAQTRAEMGRQARDVAWQAFGNAVYTRGLIEISNYCKNNCYYCGIRSGNRSASRYRLSTDEILACCRQGYGLGFRTFVLQGGEDATQTDLWIENTVAEIRRSYPDCAITLSLGEKTKEAYNRFYRAGANRYLLRHETIDVRHYGRLHPRQMLPGHRLRCLYDLKEIGYQVGTGIMVGSPGQTAEHLVADIEFIERFRPEMIGIGPFIPHQSTPFSASPAGSVELTLLLLSVFRLMFPQALIPATTALNTLLPTGREQGILAGANVVMPNLSPPDSRKKYELYNGKIATGEEAAEARSALECRMNAIGYRLSADRGDYRPVCK